MLKAMHASKMIARIAWHGPGGKAYQAMSNVGIDHHNGWRVFPYLYPDDKRVFTCVRKTLISAILKKDGVELKEVVSMTVDTMRFETSAPVSGSVIEAFREEPIFLNVKQVQEGERSYIEVEFESMKSHLDSKGQGE